MKDCFITIKPYRQGSEWLSRRESCVLVRNTDAGADGLGSHAGSPATSHVAVV